MRESNKINGVLEGLPSSLLAILGSLLALGCWALSDKKTQAIQIPQELVVAIAIASSSYFLSLIHKCWKLKNAYDLKEVRRKRIQHWRDVFETEWEREDFVDSLLYSDMRHYIRQSTVDSIDGRMKVIIRSRAGNPDKTLLMDEISRIEKSWGLI